MPAALLVAAPPRGHRRQKQLLTEQVLGQLGKVGRESRVLEDAAPQGIDDGNATDACGVDEAGHPQLGVGA